MNNENCQYCNIKIPFVKDPDRIVFQWHLAGHPNQDKPEPSYIGGVNLGVDKTEQIREIARDLHANIISVNTGVDLITQKLEEQKQEMVEEVEKLMIPNNV